MDEIEQEVFSDFSTDYRAWIGEDPLRLLAQIESRAINNGIGAGRGGGPIMERKSAGCYVLLRDGKQLLGKDVEDDVADAGQALRELYRKAWERRHVGDRPVCQRKGWLSRLFRHRPPR